MDAYTAQVYDAYVSLATLLARYRKHAARSHHDMHAVLTDVGSESWLYLAYDLIYTKDQIGEQCFKLVRQQFKLQDEKLKAIEQEIEKSDPGHTDKLIQKLRKDEREIIVAKYSDEIKALASDPLKLSNMIKEIIDDLEKLEIFNMKNGLPLNKNLVRQFVTDRMKKDHNLDRIVWLTALCKSEDQDSSPRNALFKLWSGQMPTSN